MLYPGDKLTVPGRKLQALTRPTDAHHRIVVSEEEVEFRVVLQEHNQLPYKDEPYELTLVGLPQEEVRTGKTDGDGKVIEALPRRVQRVEVYLPGPGIEFTFDLQGLLPVPRWADIDDSADPATSSLAARSMQMRLNALGFACGAEDGVLGDKTRAALSLLDGRKPPPDALYGIDDAPEANDPEANEDGEAAGGEAPALGDEVLALIDDLFEEVS